MTDRTYRMLLGIAILVILYFDMTRAMTFLVGILLFEGITNWRIPLLVNRLLHRPGAGVREMGPSAITWPLHAEQAWRLMVGFALLFTAVLFKAEWFIPWFMGFAIFGAGVSGVCPMLISLGWAGCRQ